MRVFVTGAAGFIGSRLSKALLERGDQVIGFDNFDPYYAREHKVRHLDDLRDSSAFEFIEGSLHDAELLRTEFEKWRPDAVAHMAAMAAVRYSVQHPLRYGETNVQGSAHVLDAARHIGKPTCVLASTGSVYGTSTPIPFQEDANADRPLAPYPASKRAMELFAYSYAHLWKLPTTVVRFFNVYGPHGRPDMMPWQWTRQILVGEPLTLYAAGIALCARGLLRLSSWCRGPIVLAQLIELGVAWSFRGGETTWVAILLAIPAVVVLAVIFSPATTQALYGRRLSDETS